MIDADGVKWLLNRIQFLESHPSRTATYKEIWAGSYDVWFCEQDRIDSVLIPQSYMKDAKDSGFIKSEVVKRGKYDVLCWSLTDLGREFLKT